MNYDATVKNHVKLYGEFSYNMGVTVGKLDDKFWTEARFNSDYKHLLLVYSECPDKEFNISQLMAFLNKELDVFTYVLQTRGAPHSFVALW